MKLEKKYKRLYAEFLRFRKVAEVDADTVTRLYAENARLKQENQALIELINVEEI